MAERFLLYKGAEDLRVGDLFVSAFSMKGSEYPKPRKITAITVNYGNIAIRLEDEQEFLIMKDMKIIVQDKTPLKEGKK